jgi:hypothetical protein
VSRQASEFLAAESERLQSENIARF